MGVVDSYIDKAKTLEEITVMSFIFQDLWAFNDADAILRQPVRNMPVVEIRGTQYGLNGVACMNLGLRNPHEAGVAIVGKSIGPFRDIAMVLDVSLIK